jgi:hypothetical protein
MGNHKKALKADEHLPFHKLIEDINDWYIELYEELPCNNNEELLKTNMKLCVKFQLSTVEKDIHILTNLTISLNFLNFFLSFNKY